MTPSITRQWLEGISCDRWASWWRSAGSAKSLKFS
jgi:hypothetical protein